MKTKHIKNKSGFTLLELIIVILILAVLASIIIPKFNDMIVTSKNTAGKKAVADACAQVAANSTLKQSYVDLDGPTTPVPTGYSSINCGQVYGTGEITCEVVAPDNGSGVVSQSAECNWIR